MSEKRKSDHIELAFKSQIKIPSSDFIYEPLFARHPNEIDDISVSFLGKKLSAPLWISSMTGGTEKALRLNKNLATVAGEFGFGMGLGSCRSLLESSSRLADFDMKDQIGDNPFFINLGIAQLEGLIESKKVSQIKNLIEKLQADGLIIHINPLQEWLQPEGDRYKKAPIDTIKSILKEASYPIVVKEVGQGFGPKSLESLCRLPLAAVDLSGFGGTNFSLLELSRHNAQELDRESSQYKLVEAGHTCDEMITWLNSLLSKNEELSCSNFIVSGGIKNIVDGFKLQEKLNAPSLIGMASSFLKYAEDISMLRDFVASEIENYKLAKKVLRVKK